MKKRIKRWNKKTQDWWYFDDKQTFDHFCSNSSIFGAWDFTTKKQIK